MKKLLILPLFLLALSCTSPKDSAKRDLAALCQHVEANSKNYTDDDWIRFANDYARLDSIIDAHQAEYSPEDITEIKSIKRKCTVHLITATAVKTKVGLQDAFHEAIEEITK